MSTAEQVEALKIELDALPESERLPYFKGWMASIPDPAKKAEITAIWGLLSGLQFAHTQPQPQQHIVVLLHGIRTEATWQNNVAQVLRLVPRVEVFTIGYGWLDAIRFWSPAFLGFRALPGEKILRELRDVRAEHPHDELIVVAHSFSTYLISEVLAEHTDIRLQKLLLCGSIIRPEYRWDKVKTSAEGLKIVNDVGTDDLWPVLARVTSWGYGPSGTFGFKTARVRDRYFKFKHSDFFTDDHVRKYWVSFICNNEIIDSPWDLERPNQPWFFSFIAHVPCVKLILIGALCLPLYLFW